MNTLLMLNAGTAELLEVLALPASIPVTCKSQHEVRKKRIIMFPRGQSFWLRASTLHFIIGIFVCSETVIALFSD